MILQSGPIRCTDGPRFSYAFPSFALRSRGEQNIVLWQDAYAKGSEVALPKSLAYRGDDCCGILCLEHHQVAPQDQQHGTICFT